MCNLWKICGNDALVDESEKSEYAVQEACDWTHLFMDRKNGWTGADGIFSANIDGSIETGIEKRPNQKTIFVFSDTLVGDVDHVAKTRTNTQMVNHSFAFLHGNEPDGDKIEFFFPKDGRTAMLPIKPRQDGQWYWLSECFVLPSETDIHFYTFLLRMKKSGGEGAFGFEHLGVDLLRYNIQNGAIDFNSAQITEDDPFDPHVARFRDTDQMREKAKESKTIAFGIGVLENTTKSGAPHPDEFIYIYGYHDVKPSTRQLVVARSRPNEVDQFKKWTYYAGANQWSNHLNDAVGIADNISTEISVTPIPSGPKAGKYALIYTPGTINSKIALRLGESPVGPFGEERILYEETESKRLGKGVFAYNAKAHPVLSKSGEILITYNINSNDANWRIFRESDIYFPRFFILKLDTL
ncbi:MAG: hypothetical protein ACRCUY_02560 [Thermoguttaceae bacterium]